MADKGQPYLVAVNPRRRRVGMRARRPVRPGRAFPATSELPTQDLRKRFRRHAVGIVEARTVEMIGDGTGIGLGTATEFHGPDWPQKDGIRQEVGWPCGAQKSPVSGEFP